MSTFEEQKETIRLAVLAAIRSHVPAFQDEHVQWADSPQYMQGEAGSIELAFASLVPEADREERARADEGTDRVTTRGTVYRAALDITTELVGAPGMDLMGKVVDGFKRQDTLDVLHPVKMVGPIRGVQFVKLRDAGRVKPLWICEAKLRFEVSYPTSVESEGTIGTVIFDIKLDHDADFDPPNEIDTTIEVSEP